MGYYLYNVLKLGWVYFVRMDWLGFVKDYIIRVAYVSLTHDL